MMVDAKVVLLDEVAAGVNKTLLQDLAANIERMNRELGYTFFVIEHDMDLIGRLCDPVIVMAQGEKIDEGSMSSIRANEAIVEAYFGSPVVVTLSGLCGLAWWPWCPALSRYVQTCRCGYAGSPSWHDAHHHDA